MHLEMVDSNQMVFTDSFALSFHFHFHRLLKWLLVLPFVACAIAVASLPIEQAVAGLPHSCGHLQPHPSQAWPDHGDEQLTAVMHRKSQSKEHASIDGHAAGSRSPPPGNRDSGESLIVSGC